MTEIMHRNQRVHHKNFRNSPAYQFVLTSYRFLFEIVWTRPVHNIVAIVIRSFCMRLTRFQSSLNDPHEEWFQF
jgi:hypothetical protein